MLYSTPLFSLFVVITVLFESSVAFLSYTGSRDVLHEHPALQNQIPSNRTLFNRIKLFPLSRQLWKKNGFSGVASTNESGSSSACPNIYVCWEDSKEDCLETCQKVTREGKRCYIIDLF